MSTNNFDTIVAQSTPAGRSGIGVIRLSGSRALELIGLLVNDPDWSPEPNRTYFKPLCDPSKNKLLDQAVVSFFKSPRSFTGEDVVELSCHGSPVLMSQIIDSLLSLNARNADPGEFTLRALLNGKLDLSQAEAIRDLIDAQTEAAAKQALRQLEGELSFRLRPIKESLLEIIVPLESSLEFVEDDLPDLSAQNYRSKLRELIGQIEKMAQSFRSGRLLKDGLKVSIVGRPNVGKSSIFNGLLAEERAIVTAIPGTTRDTLSEMIDINGLPVLLIDTAGIRETADVVEQMGVERTQRSISEADFVIVVLDGSVPLTFEDQEVLAMVDGSHHLIALNKSDLPTFDLNLFSEFSERSVVPVSARTGAGLSALESAVLKPFYSSETIGTDFLVTNARHFDLLQRATQSLRNADQLLGERASEELILVGLYDALHLIGGISGETTTEDVLTEIFSTFCIGK